MTALHYCVFSYNRGRFLRHCVDSLRRLGGGGAIQIFDDNSNDSDTRAALDELAAHCTIIQPQQADAGRYKCGGLYGNMQRALETLPSGALGCCVQDDMQLVRAVEVADLRDIERYFRLRPDAAFLQPTFMRGSRRELDARITRFEAEAGVYLRNGAGTSVGEHFSAVSIFAADRLRAVHWEFEPTERRNEAQARRHFGAMGFLRDPFLFYLPNVPAYRGKTKTLALRDAERRQRSGFYPYPPMDAAQVERLRARDSAQLPVAEDWLSTVPPDFPPRPWRFYPMEGLRWHKRLNSLELKVRGLWRWLRGLWSR